MGWGLHSGCNVTVHFFAGISPVELLYIQVFLAHHQSRNTGVYSRIPAAVEGIMQDFPDLLYLNPKDDHKPHSCSWMFHFNICLC